MKAFINKIWHATYPALAIIFSASGVFNLIRLTWTHFQIVFIVLSVPFIVIAGALLFSFVNDEILALRRGYKITRYDHPENRTVIYKEKKFRLRFPAEEYSDQIVLTVIDEVSWKDEMPDGAKDRRDIIIQRLVKELGRGKIPVEVKVIFLSNFVPDSYHWLRAFIWPNKYKQAKSVAHCD